MQQSILLTPLNIGYNIGLNNIQTWDQEVHDAASERSVLFKEPYESWFALKAVSRTPYLEPAFFGVRDGDIMRVSFEAMLVAGQSGIDVNLLPINADGSVASQHQNTVPAESMASYFRYFEVPVRLSLSADQIGVVLNIRNSALNSEIVLRNVRVEIESRNAAFRLRDQIVEYATMHDFLRVINVYSGTSLNPDFAHLQGLLDDGGITFDGDIAEFSADVGTFRGVFALLRNSKYSPGVNVYAEYQTNDSITITTSVRWYNGGLIQTDRDVSWPASTSVWRKHNIIVRAPSAGKIVVADFGRMGVQSSFKIRRFIVSLPRFDDDLSPVTPNQLEDYYPDLGRRMLAIDTLLAGEET